MKKHMLEIDREVEDDDRGRHTDPCRRTDDIEQAEATGFRKERETDGGSGNRMRISSVLMTTTPRLLGHRQPRPMACFRRGTTNSHPAIMTNTPPKTARRI